MGRDMLQSTSQQRPKHFGPRNLAGNCKTLSRTFKAENLAGHEQGEQCQHNDRWACSVCGAEVANIVEAHGKEDEGGKARQPAACRNPDDAQGQRVPARARFIGKVHQQAVSKAAAPTTPALIKS